MSLRHYARCNFSESVPSLERPSRAPWFGSVRRPLKFCDGLPDNNRGKGGLHHRGAEPDPRHTRIVLSHEVSSPMETPSPLHELPPINQRNHAITRFLLHRLQRHLGVRLRLHGLSTQLASGGGIIVANHFTRLETFAIPYVLY